ncbi:hypothetical protein ACFT0G_20500 [Streptomyces sp. NPDC057020]|uniref:hypothetical protein n=1 Tax=unclassified Streptomyces TaxID=2593676 RepID=UPI00363C76C8
MQFQLEGGMPQSSTHHEAGRSDGASGMCCVTSSLQNLLGGPCLEGSFVPAKVFHKSVEDDGGVLVKVEAAQPAPSKPMAVRVHSPVGTVVVLWQGAPDAVGREHHVEWTVDEDIAWSVNAWPSASGVFELREEGDRIVFRGRLSLFEDGGAVLDVGGTQILFDLADPPLPEGVDGSWVEVCAERDRVTVWPCGF